MGWAQRGKGPQSACSAAPRGWLALGWANMAPQLPVSHHPADRPRLVHIRKWTVSKCSKWASARAEALTSPAFACVVFTDASMAQARSTRHADSRAGCHLLTGEVGHRNARAHIQGRQRMVATVTIYHTGINGWHLWVLHLSARTHLEIVPHTLGYF